MARRRRRSDPLNILFTCAGRRVALLGAFRSAMARLKVSGRLIATDLSFASSAFQKADVGIEVPPVGDEGYLPRLLEIAEEHAARLLVPLTDLDLLVLARHAGEFAARGCTVMIAPEPTVAVCRDKMRTSRFLTEIGLPTMRTVTLQEFWLDPFYPCFAKPVSGSASIGAKVLRTEQQLRAHVETHGDELVVQEYVAGREYTTDVYRSRDGVVRCVVPRQRLTVRAGEVEKGVTVKDGELMAGARRIGESLEGIWGAFCCQCRRGDGGAARFFEINPRFGGGAPLSIAAGADLPLYLLEEVLGRPISARFGEFTDRLLMVRYDQAEFVPVDDITRLPGHDTPQFR
jgi:carbamoyl-phosphate synthase large subunit